MSWYDKSTGRLSFIEAWRTVLQTHRDCAAIILDDSSFSYEELDRRANSFRTNDSRVFINGQENDWLLRAVGAWLSDSTVIFFDGQLKHPPQRALPLPPIPKGSHALFFTSGTTGSPKPIIRSTEFALTEAFMLAQDLNLPEGSVTVGLIKPWFGAMTKHVLGLLLTGKTQRFSLLNPNDTLQCKPLGLYGTPSQVLQTDSSLDWQIISITGEDLTQNLARALNQRLSDNGRVYDALGSTECGVIARRWLNKETLRQIPASFKGEPFPGKTLCINEDQQLCVDAYGNGLHVTGDIATMSEGQVTLLGRSSSMRKVHGLWVDATPVMTALRLNSDVIMASLQARTNEQGQLVIDVCLTSKLSLKALEIALFQQLPNLQLFPQLRHMAKAPQLSATGKSRMTDTLLEVCDPERLSESVAKVVLMKRAVSQTSPIWKTSLEDLGLDSLDISELTLALEREKGQLLTDQILMSDTLDQIVARLTGSEGNPLVFRQLGNAAAPLEIICLGKSLAHLSDSIGLSCSFQFSPALRAQSEAYTLSGLAQDLIETNHAVLAADKMRVVVGFSIEALWAAEVAFQLQDAGLPVAGILMLDPPDGRRQALLKLRRTLFGSLPLNFKRTLSRFQREVRRNAIGQQPARHLSSPALLIQRTEASPTRGLSADQLVVAPVDYPNHKGLVTEQEGRAAWHPHFDQWLTELTQNEIRLTSESRLLPKTVLKTR